MNIADLDYVETLSKEIEVTGARKKGSLVNLDLNVVNVIQVGIPVAIAVGVFGKANAGSGVIQFG